MTLLLILFGILFVTVARGEGAGEWSDNFDQAKKTAAEKKIPLVLRFSATWCGPCRMMERTTLKDKAVLEKLGSFVRVYVDIDKETALAQQFGIHAVPTFVALSSGGDEIVRSSGAMGANDFNDWLNSALSKAAFSAARKDLFEEEKKKIAEGLKASEPADKGKFVAMLFEKRFGNETYAQDFANENLKALSQENPALFLDFLDDEKLAVRIVAGNLLREKLGAEFNFDPWEKAAARVIVIEQWKVRLATAANHPGDNAP